MASLRRLEKYLIGVSHECDWPPEAKKKLKVTFSEVTNAMSSREISQKVKNLVHRGPGVFHIKEGVLKKLKPNLILTQELCEVCAATPSVILRTPSLSRGTKDLKIVSLEPESVDDILENILLVGQVTGYSVQAEKAVKKLRQRLKKIATSCTVRCGTRNDSKRPKVCVVEWLDPIMIAGHWVPQMVNLAGGINLITKPREKSKKINLYQIIQSELDILIISPCGFDIQRTIKEKKLIDNLVRPVGVVRVYLVDGNAYMTRPGSRIVDGIEILAEIIHPEIFPRKHNNKDWRYFP